MHRRSLRALIVFGLFYVVFGVYLTLNQERIVYQPWPQDFYRCPGFAAAELVTHQGTRMYGRFTANQPVAVLYHGNAGSACDRAFLAELFTAAGYGYLVVEYAGYSNDPTPPSHERIKHDVRNVIDFIDRRNITEVAVVGESIGTGVASYHTALAPPERLLLISPFTDLAAIAAARFWFYPTRLLVTNAFQPQVDLQNYSGNVTIIHGSDDTIIPYRLGQSLYASLSTEKQFVTIDGAGHNNLFQYDATFAALATFFSQD